MSGGGEMRPPHSDHMGNVARYTCQDTIATGLRVAIESGKRRITTNLISNKIYKDLIS